jgi:rhamnogalacturonyl hydrolase YesR
MVLAPRNAEGICYHFDDKPEMWVDSLYMLPPFLAAAGRGEEAMRQWLGLFALLYDAQAGLLSHQWDDARRCFVRQAHWGVGNGWAVASAARLVGLLPKYRADILERTVPLIDRLLSFARPDGLFHDVVDDPNTFPEVNLSQMLAYTLYRGMAEGWLDAGYAPQADAMYEAACARVDAFGQVWQVCGAPHFDKPGTAPEGQAFHLLMSAARDRYDAVRGV